MTKFNARTVIAMTLGLVLAGGGFLFIVNGHYPGFVKKPITGIPRRSTPLHLKSITANGESGVDTATRKADKLLIGTENDKSSKSKYLSLAICGKQNFTQSLLVAAEIGDIGTTSAMISEAMLSVTGVDYVKHFLGSEEFPLKARKHVSEALIRIGSQDPVELVLAASTKEFKLGHTEEGSSILSSLQISVGLEGARGLLNILLRQNESEDISYPLPIEVRSAVQKSLRGALESEEVGICLAQRYSDLMKAGKDAIANDLLEGVAHPAMLGELVADAHNQRKAGDVYSLFERLIATDDPGVFGALVRLASKEPSLLNDISQTIFNWSFDHPHQAQPGLFAEYLNNQVLPAEQRVVAAYGLAGSIGRVEAGFALKKAISGESDPYMQQCLQNALVSLQIAVDAESGGRLLAK